jgi:hypothetical protein
MDARPEDGEDMEVGDENEDGSDAHTLNSEDSKASADE